MCLAKSCFAYIADASCLQLKSALQCWTSVAVSCNIRIEVMSNCPMILTSQPSMSFFQSPQLIALTLSYIPVHSRRSVSLHSRYRLLLFIAASWGLVIYYLSLFVCYINHINVAVLESSKNRKSLLTLCRHVCFHTVINKLLWWMPGTLAIHYTVGGVETERHWVSLQITSEKYLKNFMCSLHTFKGVYFFVNYID